MRKYKYKFLGEEDDGGAGAEEVIDTFIVFLGRETQAQAPVAEVKGILRKAKYALLAAEELDQLDADAVLTKFLACVAAKATAAAPQ